MTAMASASLALYLRYLVDPGPPEFRHLQLENSFYQYTNPQSNVAHHPAVPVNGMPGNDGHLRDKTRKQDQNVDAHYESHHAVEDQNPYKNYHESSFHNPPGLDTSLSLHQKNGPPNLKDMMSRTWNFMGSYQRKYGPQFQPIYAGTNLHEDENGKPAADMVHKADVKKELPDWTISFLNSKMKPSNKMPTLLETNLKNSGVTKSTLSRTKNVSDHGVGGDVGQFVAAPWRRYKDVLHNTKTAHPSHNVNLTHPVKKDSHVDESKNGQLQVHIIEIHSPLQNDLDHYLVAVVLISLVCLLVLFQYFRQRRKYVKSKTRVF